MNAISIPNRAIYDCNINQLGPNMIAMTKIVLESREYDFWTNLLKIKFRFLQSYLVLFGKDCNHIWSDWDLTLQSYIVHFGTEIVIIFSHLRDQDCKHIWSRK